MTNVLRHNTFSKLSQASKGYATTLFQNCRKLPIVLKKCVAPQKKVEEESELFREGLMLRRQKYVAKLRRFLKQLELVDSFKKSLSVAPIVLKKCVTTPI